MISFRDRRAKELGIKVIEYINEDGLRQGINPFDHGAAYTDIMKTQALKQAIEKYGFTAAFGGARRDEEKSRAKERIIIPRSIKVKASVYSLFQTGQSWISGNTSKGKASRSCRYILPSRGRL